MKIMNERQRRIYDWLKEIESNLSELYGGATKLIEDKTFPGRERLICHAVREIRNRLPKAVAGEGILEEADEFHAVSPVKVLDLADDALGGQVARVAFIEERRVAEGALGRTAAGGVQRFFPILKHVDEVPGRVGQFVEVLDELARLVDDHLAVVLPDESADLTDRRCAGLQVFGQFHHEVLAGADAQVVDVFLGDRLLR